MRILMVDQLARKTGRDTVALARELGGIGDLDVDVYLADRTNSAAGGAGGVRVWLGFRRVYEGNALLKALRYARGLLELAHHIRRNSYDVVYLQWFSLPWVEWAFVLWLRHTGHRVLVLVHDITPRDRRLLEGRFLNAIYDLADVLLVHTEYADRLLRERYRIHTPTRVVTQAFCRKQDYEIPNRAAARGCLHIPGGRTVFLFFGTIHPTKGLDVLIRAFSRAYERDRGIFLLVAGEPRRVDLDEYRRLIVERLGEGNSSVRLGYVPQAEERLYFGAADVLCLPYLQEEQSGVAQLGLMYELPMIATDVGAMGEVVRDGENGALVPPGDEDRLRDAILELAASPEARQRYAARSKSLGEGEFSLRGKAERVAAACREVLG